MSEKEVQNIEIINGITTKKDTQLRNWFITENNPITPIDEFYEYLKNLEDIRYFILGYEKESTPHYHYYLEFSSPVRFSKIKNHFPTAHIEPKKGTRIESRDYVLKVGKFADKAHTKLREPLEYGKFKLDGERSDLDEIMDDIENGLTDLELSRKYQGKYARHEKWANKYRQDFLQDKYGKNPRLDLKVIYISGRTGIGKTRYIVEKHGYENTFFISDYERYPFDNYENQPVIVFEEFRSQIAFSLMLRCIDIHPLKLPARYQNKQACFTTVYIVSNRTLSEQYPNIQKEYPHDWAAFLRRIHEVYDFNKSKNETIQKFEQIKIKLVPVNSDTLPF